MSSSASSEETARAWQAAARLEHDARLVLQVVAQRLKGRPVNSSTGDHGNYFAVTGDLWRRLGDYCLGVSLLLQRGGYESAVVV